jgi:hypothetical protein
MQRYSSSSKSDFSTVVLWDSCPSVRAIFNNLNTPLENMGMCLRGRSQQSSSSSSSRNRCNRGTAVCLDRACCDNSTFFVCCKVSTATLMHTYTTTMCCMVIMAMHVMCVLAWLCSALRCANTCTQRSRKMRIDSTTAALKCDRDTSSSCANCQQCALY